MTSDNRAFPFWSQDGEWIGIRGGLRRGVRAITNYTKLLREIDKADQGLLLAIIGAMADNDWTEVGRRFGRVQLEQATKRARLSLKGAARRLAEAHDLERALLGVPHLGVLQPLCGADYSRWHYALLTCEAALRMKQAERSLGLSARVEVAGKKRFSRLELVQAWSLLFNYGHLFGTFSTERMALYQLSKHADWRDAFIADVQDRLRVHVRRLVNDQDLFRFHIALAVWRVSRWPDSTLRTQALHCFTAYFESDRDAPERWAFRTARRAGYTQLHGIADASGRFIKATSVASLNQVHTWSRIVTPGAVLGDRLVPPSLQVMNALDRYHEEVLFASPEAAAHVLQHLREFGKWQRASKRPFPAWLEPLFARPEDWPGASTPRQEGHVGRLRYRTKASWLAEVAAWLGGDGQEQIWREANFVLMPQNIGAQDQLEHTVAVDIYSEDGVLSPTAMSHVAQLVSARARGMDEDLAFDVSAGQLLASHLESCFGEDIQLNLRLIDVDGSPRVCLFDDHAGLRHQISRLANRVSEDRAHELNHLVQALEALEGDGVWAAFLCQVIVLNRPDWQEVTDLDGVLVRFHEEGEDWVIVESKTGNGTGVKQQTDLLQHLEVPCDGPDQDLVAGCSCLRFSRSASSEPASGDATTVTSAEDE